jgi:glycosyltransferase involved in cell wall biosynthesis
MIIGIDNVSPGLATSRQTLGGMRHFLQGLITHLPAYEPAHEFSVFTPEWADPFDWPRAPNLTVATCPGVPQRPLGRVVYEQLNLPAQLQKHDVSLWMGTCNSLPLRWSGRSVVILQSFQYFTQPASYSALRRLYLRALVPASLRRADRVVTFSQVAKDDIVRRLGISPSKVAVIHHALRFPAAVRNASDDRSERDFIARRVGGEYILSVSAFYPYKNLARLIEAFARLKPDLPYKLVMSGAETATIRQANLRQIARQLGVEQDVVFVGRVPDEELPAFYRQAAVLAMPSLDETFGFPVLEAMAFGCPVVTSNLSSMPEISGAAAVLVDPFDVASISDGLRRVLQDSDLRHSMIEAGRARAQNFTYEHFFQQLLQVIKDAGPVDFEKYS